MADRTSMLLEGERRGILTPELTAELNDLRQRGAIKGQKGMYSATEMKEARAKVIAARQLRRQIDRVEVLFNRTQSGKGLAGLKEYLPTQGNATFDSSVANLRVVGKPFFRVPGEGANSDKDQSLTDESLPNRFGFDDGNVERIRGLREFVDGIEASYGPIAGMGVQQSRAKPKAAAKPSGVIDFNDWAD